MTNGKTVQPSLEEITGIFERAYLVMSNWRGKKEEMLLRGWGIMLGAFERVYKQAIGEDVNLEELRERREYLQKINQWGEEVSQKIGEDWPRRLARIAMETEFFDHPLESYRKGFALEPALKPEEEGRRKRTATYLTGYAFSAITIA